MDTRSDTAADAVIRIRRRALEDLFVAFDPSPVERRDLDPAIEAFIVESALDAPARAPIRIAIALPPAEAVRVPPVAVEAAIRNHFTYLRDRESGRLKRLWRDGRQALAVGLAFLAACVAIGRAAMALAPGGLGAFIAEGLVIAGWVANWRPLEIFLYDWRPVKRLRDLYGRIAAAEVTLRESTEA